MRPDSARSCVRASADLSAVRSSITVTLAISSSSVSRSGVDLKRNQPVGLAGDAVDGLYDCRRCGLGRDGVGRRERMLESQVAAMLVSDHVGAELRGSAASPQPPDRLASKQGERSAIGELELAVDVADRDRLGERVEQRSAPLHPPS